MEKFDYRDCTITVHPDQNPANPCEEQDMLGTMLCWHSRYNLGHKHDYRSVEDIVDFLNHEKPTILMPLYLYDHSGISISTHPFSCPWDSGQVGWVYTTQQCILKEWSCSQLSPQLQQKARERIEGEVRHYNDYLTGQVYGFEATHNNTLIHSVWGYYGDPDTSGLIEDAKASIDDHMTAHFLI